MVYIYLCALGRSRPSMSMFLKSFLTLRICFQSFGQSSIKVGSMVQPIFWKIDSTFVSKFLSSTCRGIPATSKHSLLEYGAFAQRWHSTVTILLQSSLLTRLVTTSSAWSLAKLSLKLRISWSMVLLSSVVSFCNERTIGMSSLFSILSKASSVYCYMTEIVARWRLGWKV